MKILILTSEFDPFRGGIGAYAREIATAATELGHEVMLYAPDYFGDQTALDRAFAFTVRRYRGKAASMSRLPARIALVRRIASRESFDCVHAVDWGFYVPLALSPFRGRARCVVTFHGSEINFMRAPRRSFAISLCRFWNGWARYVGNSRFTAEHLMKTFPQVPRDKVDAIPLGVNESWHRGAVERSVARARLSIPEDRFLVMSLGRITPRKGHLVVCEALTQLPPAVAEKIDWHIIGPTAEPEHLERLKRAIEVGKVHAVFDGTLGQDAIYELLSAADVFCLPGFQDDKQQFEGFGLVYLEAGALGLPSVATGLGGVPDAVIGGESGLLVPPNDPAAVGRAILRLYEDPALRTHLAEGARAHARSLTWTRVARGTYEPG